MKRAALFLILFAGLQLCSYSYAFTAIAEVPDYSVQTIYAAWNWPTQKEADQNALAGCQKSVRDEGLATAGKQCVIRARQANPGAGALICGEGGCAFDIGQKTLQIAADAVYQRCMDNKYGNCRSKDITGWWDEAGYPVKVAEKMDSKETCGPPPGQTVRSTYNCTNGDCTRTFDNGCTVRFKAPYCHDPLTGKWDWKPDGC